MNVVSQLLRMKKSVSADSPHGHHVIDVTRSCWDSRERVGGAFIQTTMTLIWRPFMLVNPSHQIEKYSPTNDKPQDNGKLHSGL